MMMGKKLRDLAGGLADNQLAMTVKESAQQIWLAGMGAFAKAQEGRAKVFEALMREGANLQRRTQAAAEERINDVTGRMSAMAGGAGTLVELAFQIAVGSGPKKLKRTGNSDHEKEEKIKIVIKIRRRIKNLL